MAVEDRRSLQALQAIADNSYITQRRLASQLGIALGLTNLYLKRLVRKGFVKCVNMQSNRLRYILTPKGIVEKTRLTYEFMEFSLVLYRQVRQHLRTALETTEFPDHMRRIAVYGTGEAAELAYLSITECGFELAAVFGRVDAGPFFGHVVRSIEHHRHVEFDRLLVATLDRPEPVVQYLTSLGVDRERLVLLR
jgi:DNA-binding MarR family transcriptional regulator